MKKREIVCVSFNAPPMNDAEALCTIRLLSALAREGHSVHLITSDPSPTLDDDIAKELMDPTIEVTRVSSPVVSSLNRFISYCRFGLHVPYLDWCFAAINATKAILAEKNKPILMTRSMPLVSNLVGYYCRNLAAAWIPHFSDPYPPVHWSENWYSGMGIPLHRRWARRFAVSADLITTTCSNASRYFQKNGRVRLGKRIVELPHLAIPRLKPMNFQLNRSPDEFIVAHFGNLMSRRHPDVLIKGVSIAAERSPGLRFIQYGNIDSCLLYDTGTKGDHLVIEMKNINNLSPRESADLQNQVDVNVVIDTDLGIEYSPFILSKYPHAVCSGKPLLMITAADSAMMSYTKKFGGGICVGYEVESIADALISLFENRHSSRFFPSDALKRQFSVPVALAPLFDFFEEI